MSKFSYEGSRPKHLEAYPRLDCRKAAAALARGKDLCQFIDEAGRSRGDVYLDYETEERVLISYRFFRDYLDYDDGRYAVRVEYLPDGLEPGRAFFRCGGCDRRLAILIFAKRRWACATCQSLLYRKQIISRDVALFEEIAALEQLVRKGREPYGRQSIHAKRLARLAQLRKWRRGRPYAFASKTQLFHLQAVWVCRKDLEPGQVFTDIDK